VRLNFFVRRLEWRFVKQRIAKISLVVALVLFFSGFLVLCYCPGWYALAAGFAGVTVWLGAGRMRAWGILWVLASLALTAVHAYAKVREGERVREIRQRYEQKHRQETNSITPPNKPDGANRRQPLGFRARVADAVVTGLTAAVAHPGRWADIA
jgi:membrane protein implicated in regulation of membrane protease activity